MVAAITTLSNSSDPTNYSQLPDPEKLGLWTRIGIARNQVEPQLRLVHVDAVAAVHVFAGIDPDQRGMQIRITTHEGESAEFFILRFRP
jgi:hypothetical protein